MTPMLSSLSLPALAFWLLRLRLARAVLWLNRITGYAFNAELLALSQLIVSEEAMAARRAWRK